MKGSRRVRMFALGVLGLSLGATLLLAGTIAARERLHRQTLLAAAAREVATRLTGGLRAMYEQLAAGAALLEFPGPTVTDAVWREYIQALRSGWSDEVRPFIGYVERVAAADLEDYISALRAANFPDFTMSSYPDSPGAPHDDHFLLRRCEPSGPDTPPIGLDVGTNPRRRRAIERARDTGEMTLTEPSALTAFRPGETGFIFNLPVYRPGRPRSTVEQRRAAFQGSLGSPVALSALLEDIPPAATRLAAFSVADLGGAGEGETLLFSAGNPLEEGLRTELATHTLRVANRTWFIRARPTPAFAAAHPLSASRRVLLGGGLVSLLLGLVCQGLLASQAHHERRRRVALNQFELAVQSAGLAPYRLDFTTGRIEWKAPPRELDRLFAGNPPATLKAFLSLLDDPGWETWRRTLATPSTRPAPFDTTHRLRLADGEERVLHNRGTALAGPGGATENVFGILWDGTARQREAQELLRSETRYRTLFESCLDAVLLLDENEKIRECNRAAVEIFGAAGREALLGLSPVDDLSPPEQPDGTPSRMAVEKVFRGLQQSGTVRFSWLQRRLDTGRPFPAEVSLSTPTLEGRPFLLGLVRDVSERIARERRITEHRGRLQALATALFDAEHAERRRVAAGLHDDLCQSLVLARLRLQGVRDLPGPDARREACGGLLTLLHRLRATCDSMAFDLTSPRLDREGLAAALRELCEHTARESGLACAYTESGAAALLPADRGAFLYHAARELLANVRRHAAAPSARVTLRAGRGRVTLAVADNGRGMPKREGAGLTPEGGFGLFSIGEHAANLGGRLRCFSRPGGGTLAVVRLPVAG